MFYSIKEVSEKLNLPSSKIRYYEKQGLIVNIKRSAGGIRQFDDHDIQWIFYISCFLKTGMKLANLRKIVELGMAGDFTLYQRMEILETHRVELQNRQRDLDLAKEALKHKLAYYKEKISN